MDSHIEKKREIWVVRHTAVDVAPGICYGGTDVGLKETFEEEASVVAEKLQGYDPDAVFTSPLSRAHRLAEATGYGHAKCDDRLREQHFGAWEMQYYEEITDPQLKVWYEDYVDEVPTGGESFRQVVARVGDFIEEVRASGYERVLVFAHGGVQMAVGAHLGLYSLREAPDHFQGYGSVLVYEL